jgi:phosphoglycolate phosphatase-like HAD superfamily hydrolase
LWELDYLGLTPHFAEILTGHSETDGYDVKIELIKEKLGNDEGLIIGDTEADIIAGKQLGLQTFAVTSGIRDRAFLEAIEPDHVLDSVGMAALLILSSSKY